MKKEKWYAKVPFLDHRVKSGYYGHRVNSLIHLQTVDIQVRWLLMSRLIRIFTVCLVSLFLIPMKQTRSLSEFS